MPEDRRPPGSGGPANPGWYIDPWGRSAWRWWDGWQWTGWLSPPETHSAAVVRALVPESSPHPPAPPEAPGRERLPGGAPAGIAGLGEELPTTPGPGSAPRPVYPSPPGPGYLGAPIAPGPAQPVPPGERRRLLGELVIVLAIFPLPYVWNALQSLAASIAGNAPEDRIPILITGHVLLSLPFVILDTLVPLAAAALVVYLLSLPGRDGGPKAIGLDRLQPRGDLALMLPVFFLCFLVPEVGIGIILNNLHVHTVVVPEGSLPSYYNLAYVVSALAAGVVEEIVVLGYLVRRLEQLGLRPASVVVIAVAVRCSYHLYYGWGVLAIMGWATVTVLVYMRYRRLWPFILVHALWDCGTLIEGRFLGFELLVLLIATIVFTAVWHGYLPRKAWVPPGGGHGAGELPRRDH